MNDLFASPLTPARLLVALIVSTSLIPAAQAADEATPPEQVRELPPAETRPTTFYGVDLFGQYLSRSDVDDTSGGVSVVRAGADFSMRHAVSSKFQLLGHLRHEISDYDFNRPGGLFPGAVDTQDPFDEVHETRASLGFLYALDEQWSLFGTGVLRAGFEGGARFEDSLTGGGFGGFGYAFTEEFSMQFGLGVLTRLEDDPLVIPIVGFRWQITDTLRAESEGIAGRLSWAATDDFTLSAFARYSTRDYRLDRSNDFLPGGVLRDDRLVLGAGATWTPSPAVQVSAEVGASVWQRFRFYDEAGNELNDPNTDPQFLIGGRVEFRF
ncbi:MAG: hypothetical protein ACNA8P_04095 [Phycisphaerales bacterium]